MFHKKIYIRRDLILVGIDLDCEYLLYEEECDVEAIK